jgi:alkanesulfonate monooxygenase SsuD/methylene tetrahydromethanopterin reductase-like flavin-dependent oxidoreductase (luciferase family)
MALPTMAVPWSSATWKGWCSAIDDGPFASISCGERITFRNVEMLTTLAAAAALTERVRVMANLVVAPWHAAALLAKQLATLDVLSDGRLDVGLGVGGRDQDYESLGVSAESRHQRLDDQVAALTRLWSGEPAVPGCPPLGPPLVQRPAPPLYAGAAGPKALRRAARWATGVSGFSFDLDVEEISALAGAADEAWREVGSDALVAQPRLVVACFFVLGREAPAKLERFTYEYLEVFGPQAATALSKRAVLSSSSALEQALSRVAAETPCAEVILVPGDTDRRQVEEAASIVAGLKG